MEKYDKHYIKFERGHQTAFLREIKERSFDSWEEVATYLGVNRSMVFFYLNEKHKLPKSSFDNLSKISNINQNKFSFEILPFSIYGSAKVPKEITPPLAEFVGIMLGDGCCQSKTYQITICGGTIDGTYITEYIPNLIEKLFSKRVSFRKISREGFDCIFASKKISEYLTKEMCFMSPKSNCSIPKQFFYDNELLKACVRGLFDTDGGLHKNITKNLHSYTLQISQKL